MTTAVTRSGRTRPAITSPDGRIFAGQYPHLVKKTSETPYAAALANMIGGVMEVTLPAGRVDVATDTTTIEVEPVRTWRSGARQAFAYGAMAGLTPAVAVFGADDYLDIYLTVRDRMPGLTLWGWRRDTWVQITNRRAAGTPRKTPAPQVPPRFTAAAAAVARRGQEAKWAKEIDPDGTMLPADLELRIESARQAHMLRMRLALAKSRRTARGRAA